jgi:hypothetical protein
VNRSILLPIVILLAAPCMALRAGSPCCQGCGCQPCTKKVCRLKCEMKEVRKKVYSCKCEDFCVPGKSICCKKPCDDCRGLCRLCCDPYIYKPTCGCVRTRVVPVIEIEKKKVPSYTCVVEEVCTRCGHCCSKLDFPSAEDAPTALAMVKGRGYEMVTTPEIAVASHETEMFAAPAAPEATPVQVSSRNFVERLFVRK